MARKRLTVVSEGGIRVATTDAQRAYRFGACVEWNSCPCINFL